MNIVLYLSNYHGILCDNSGGEKGLIGLLKEKETA